MDSNGVVEIKDFTVSVPQTRKFRIEPDVFEAVAEIPIGSYVELTKLRGNLAAGDFDGLMSQIKTFFSAILLDDSFERFWSRLTDKKNPLGIQHILPLMEWLMEGYGLRPTQPVSSSSSNSEEAGSTTSTDGAQLEASTGEA